MRWIRGCRIVLKSGPVLLFLPLFFLVVTPSRADDADASSRQSRGEALFQNQCAICHGVKGDGEGKFAYLMNPRPRNFLNGKFGPE